MKISRFYCLENSTCDESSKHEAEKGEAAECCDRNLIVMNQRSTGAAQTTTTASFLSSLDTSNKLRRTDHIYQENHGNVVS